MTVGMEEGERAKRPGQGDHPTQGDHEGRPYSAYEAACQARPRQQSHKLYQGWQEVNDASNKCNKSKHRFLYYSG